MKIIFVTALLFITGFISTGKKENISMPGAYKMLSQSVKTEKTDSTSTALLQLKIYTDGYIMYANVNPADSVSSFGIGTYSTTKDGVVENVIYNASDSTKNETPASYSLLIKKTPKGYKQIIADMMGQGGQKITLTEEYQSVGTVTKSAIDGAWKQTKAYTIKGTTTTDNTATQYKTYYAGHVIWGHNYTDAANKTFTGIGFGKFKMTGTNKLKEYMTASTYYQVRGKDFDIDIEMIGKDEFKQTMNNSDGSKNVEVYKRMKK